MKRHGLSKQERSPNSPTVRNWRSNLIAIVILGVLALAALVYLLRSAL